jgi:membrane protease YdiL (CAAX protease family)
MKLNIKKTLLFVGLTFLLSWLLALLFYAFGGRWNTLPAIIMATAYMFIPLIVVIIIQKLIYKEPVKKPLGISFKLNRWFVVAWLLPLVIALAAFGLGLLFPATAFSPDMSGMFERLKLIFTPEQLNHMQSQVKSLPLHPFWMALVQSLIAGFTINAVAAFGEELGWRGFMLKELGYLGFWKSSAIIGLIWGIWHAPLIIQGHNYPQHHIQGVFMMTIFCLLLSPIISFVRLKSKSVIAAAIFHGSLNSTSGLAILLIKGGNDLTIGITGAAGFIILLIANLFLFFYNRSEGKKLLLAESIV